MNQYLEVPFREKDAAKALGARWDGGAKKWYVPAGTALAPFSAWLPAGSTSELAERFDTVTELKTVTSDSRELAGVEKGISLSQLLAGVSQLVATAYKSPVWTMVEVVEVSSRNGHVYLDLSERSVDGRMLARAKGMIWSSTAQAILPQFERATGAQLAPGIKLLVRGRPVFKPEWGFSIEIDAIDSEYTLGDLEAKKREIRKRLQQEGVYEANRRLPAVWDFNAVLVVAPEMAAGLGDFKAEAERLSRFGICRFVYVHSRFQGEGAPEQIRKALLDGLQAWRDSGRAPPDAVVIIRGGGAVNDLAWLNDYALAHTVCTLPVPVLTGLGHERDSTILDEVANHAYDTPSKVAAGIEQTVRQRAGEVNAHFQRVIDHAMGTTTAARAEVERQITATRSGAERQIASARQSAAEWINELQLGATKTVHRADQMTRQQMTSAERDAQRLLLMARERTPALISDITLHAGKAVAQSRERTQAHYDALRDVASASLRRRREVVLTSMQDVVGGARRSIGQARSDAASQFQTIAGMGPGKTLQRGFAIVRDAAGATVTSSASVAEGNHVEIEFRDGRVAVQVIRKAEKNE